MTIWAFFRLRLFVYMDIFMGLGSPEGFSARATFSIPWHGVHRPAWSPAFHSALKNLHFAFPYRFFGVRCDCLPANLHEIAQLCRVSEPFSQAAFQIDRDAFKQTS